MLMNISEMFCYAQTAVLHPTAPLYSVEDKIVCYILVIILFFNLVNISCVMSIYISANGEVQEISVSNF